MVRGLVRKRVIGEGGWSGRKTPASKLVSRRPDRGFGGRTPTKQFVMVDAEAIGCRDALVSVTHVGVCVLDSVSEDGQRSFDCFVGGGQAETEIAW